MTDAYTPPPREDLERWHNCLENLRTTDEDTDLVAHDLAARLRLVPVQEVLKDDAMRHQQKMILALRRLRKGKNVFLLSDSEGETMIDALRDLITMDPLFEATFAARQEANFDTFFPALIEDVFVHQIAGRFLGPWDMLRLERTNSRLAGTKFMDRAWAAVGARRFRDRRTGEVLPAFTALLTLADRVSVRNLVFWCNYVLQYTARCFSSHHCQLDTLLPSYENFGTERPDGVTFAAHAPFSDSFAVLGNTAISIGVLPMTLGLIDDAREEETKFWTEVPTKPTSLDPIEWFRQRGTAYLSLHPLGPTTNLDSRIVIGLNAVTGRLEFEPPSMDYPGRQPLLVAEPSVASRRPLEGDDRKAFQAWNGGYYDMDFVPMAISGDPEDGEPETLYTLRFHFRGDSEILRSTLVYVNWTALMRLFVKHGATIAPPMRKTGNYFNHHVLARAWAAGVDAWCRQMREWSLLHHLRSAWFYNLAGSLPQAGKAPAKKARLAQLTQELMLPMWRFFNGDTAALAPELVEQMAAGHPYQKLSAVIKKNELDSCTYAGYPQLYLI